jgi:hypothetical protein
MEAGNPLAQESYPTCCERHHPDFIGLYQRKSCQSPVQC